MRFSASINAFKSKTEVLRVRGAWSKESFGDGLIEAIKNQPWGILLCAALLLMFSWMCVRSASYEAATGQYLAYSKKQVVWMGLGFVAFFVVQMIPYRWLIQGAPLYYLLGLVALCLVFVLGVQINGSRRWFSLGVVRVQPSEFMKLALIIALAQVVGETGESIQKLKGWLLPAILTGVPFVLVLKQPDLGTALTFVPIFGVSIYIAGARIWHLLSAALLGVLSLPIAWTLVLQGYQKERILSFLNPEAMAQKGAYQQLMSILAIACGGVFGRGFEGGSHGRLGFCPERHTDFIFAVVGEEFGFLGSVLLLCLYGTLFTLLIRLGSRIDDVGGRLIVTGVATIFALQVVVNVAMNTGCGPITGLTLPMMSYGGSSMLSSALALGFVAVVARQGRGPFG